MDMRRMLLSLGASIADTQFKRMPQGWIFRAPTPWYLGPRPHYLVSVTQKAKIEMVIGASYFVAWVLLAAIGLVLFLRAPSVPLKASSVSNDPLLFFVLCCLLVPGLQNLYHCLALRALLKSSPRTTEKITFTERLKPRLAMYSVGSLTFLLMFLLVVLFLFAYQATTANAWDILSYIGVAALGDAHLFWRTAPGEASVACTDLTRTAMHRMLLRFGTPVADAQFKRASQGWIFRAPSPWVVGPRPHYLVSEIQKAKIVMVLGAGNLVGLVLVALVTIGFALFSTVDPKDRLLFFVLCCLLVLVLQNFYHYFALRVLVKNLPSTTEQIALDERLTSLAAMYPLVVLIIGLVLGLVMLLFSAYQVLTAKAWDVFPYIGVAVFGWIIIYAGALLRVKLRSPGPI